MPHIKTSHHRKADITAIVTTYNQSLHLTLVSIASAALQKGLEVQILVADDCSHADLTQAYSQFLNYLGHRDYRIVRHDRNVKTVQNIYKVLPAAHSPFVKCFGAGDLLYSFDSLFHIASSLSVSESSGGFGKLIAFNNLAEQGVRFHAPRNPREYNESSPSDSAKLFSKQMLTADWIPGCCQFWRTESLIAALNKLSFEYNVRYCEDFAMTLMLYKEIPHFLDLPTLWYEIGSGISTGGNVNSAKRLYHDHANFYNEAARKNPFGKHLYTARLGFDFRRFIALHTPIYQALQAKVAKSYQSAPDTYPYNELFLEAHSLVDCFMNTHRIEEQEPKHVSL